MLLAFQHAKKAALTDRRRGSPTGGLLLATALLVLSCRVLSAQSVRLTDDAYVVSGSSANYGAMPLVQVGPTQNGLLKFDLSTLPLGTTASQVTVATLRLYVSRVATAGSFNVSVATGAWSESTVTGTSAPGIGAAIVSGAPVNVSNAYIVMDVTAQE